MHHTNFAKLNMNLYKGFCSKETPFSSDTVYAAIKKSAQKHPEHVALKYLGKSATYSQTLNKIDTCANALRSMGIQPGECITIALPNCPQAIYLFYATNAIGAVANMVHPLTSEKQIEYYVKNACSTIAFIPDFLFHKFQSFLSSSNSKYLIVTSLCDESHPAYHLYHFFQPRSHIPKHQKKIMSWTDFLMCQNSQLHFPLPCAEKSAPAAILYSGGTTGTPKGVTLSNQNLNALAIQIRSANPTFQPGDHMLSVLPMCHSFGLGICIHSMLYHGGCCVLIPKFAPKSCARSLIKHRCAFVTGVPTLYHALFVQKFFRNKNLSFLKGIFSGGDTLSSELKSKLDTFLLSHGSSVTVREGYGATETSGACCLMPLGIKKDGSVGVPLPGNFIKIQNNALQKECAPGEIGEILISGPTVMQYYWNHPEETAQVLAHHTDGRLWLHSGDLGMKDPEGYLFLLGRKKRMIISSGYNIYPSQLEAVLNSHNAIVQSCVVGIPDPRKGQRVKAFIQLKKQQIPSKKMEYSILEYCRLHVSKYAIPSEIEFCSDLPKTQMGKLDYCTLEDASSD